MIVIIVFYFIFLCLCDIYNFFQISLQARVKTIRNKSKQQNQRTSILHTFANITNKKIKKIIYNHSSSHPCKFFIYRAMTKKKQMLKKRTKNYG